MSKKRSPSNSADLQVLIVGDSRSMNKVLQGFFMSFGVLQTNIHFCANGTETMAFLETVRVDLVLTSLWIPPPLNGLELLEAIRSHPKESINKMPYIILVGKDHPAHREKANELGVSGYMTKPFKVDALHSLVDRIFEMDRLNTAAVGFESEKKEGLVKTDAPNSRLAGMKVMIVDDSSTNISILKNTLSGEGLEFVEAKSAEKALQILSEDLPDLIVLDVMMSGLTGFQMCEILKNENRTNNIPVIFLSALEKKQFVLDGLNLGGADYISKPFVPEEIRLRIMNQLQLKKVMQEKECLIQELVETKKRNEELIDDLLATKEELELQALTDHLTGLLNRRAMWKIMEEEKRLKQGAGAGFSVVLSDIDYFKKVNDALGHEAGDLVLQEVAGRLKKALNGRGEIARWGGEEFLIFLGSTNLEFSRNVAEDMRFAVEEKPVFYKEKSLKVSMSFGVAFWEGGNVMLESLIQTADSALYNAKKEGRNRVVAVGERAS